jgi:hypothetical protein
MLLALLAQHHPTAAQEVASVIRAHALEIVDDHGRVPKSPLSAGPVNNLRVKLRLDGELKAI